MSFSDQGKVPTLNCIALKIERMVKASAERRSTPDRVIVIKVAKPATMVIEGLTVVVMAVSRADFLSSLISSFLSFSTLLRKILMI